MKIRILKEGEYEQASKLIFEDYRPLLKNKSQKILLIGAIEANQIIGAVLFILSVEGQKNSTLLGAIFVPKFFRNLGIATELLRHAQEKVKNGGFQYAEGEYKHESPYK